MSSDLIALLKNLCLPPGINIWPLLLLLFFFKKNSSIVLYACFLSISLLYLFSIPLVSRTLASWIEPNEIFAIEQVPNDSRTALVIPGCSRYGSPPEYSQDDVSPCSLIRLRYAAEILTRLDPSPPILISGGRVHGEVEAESEIMARIMTDRFNYPVRWLETDSKDTYENASESARILEQHGIRNIILVTHALHMKRASLLFENAGINVFPAPTYFINNDRRGFSLYSITPTSEVLNQTRNLLKEILGLLWFRLWYS